MVRCGRRSEGKVRSRSSAKVSPMLRCTDSRLKPARSSFDVLDGVLVSIPLVMDLTKNLGIRLVRHCYGRGL